MNKCTRQQIMIDQQVQGALIGRVVLYLCLSLVATILFSCCGVVWFPPANGAVQSSHLVLRSVVPAAFGALLVAPLAISDIIRQSNRFVGPVHRLRNSMKRVHSGDSVTPESVREEDHWADVIEQFNQLLLQCPAKIQNDALLRRGNS